jgi:hypothetical protein
MRVTVDDGRIVNVEPVPLDGARWAHETLDVTACSDAADVLRMISSVLSRLHAEAGGRPLAARFTLTGTTPAHARLVVNRERIEADARALGFQIGGECWVERVKIATRAPARGYTALE